MRRTFAVAACVLLLAGCATLAPQYRRPEPPVPARWPSGPAYGESAQGGQSAALGWREFYTDERMQEVISLALAGNRDLRVAASNIEKAHALYRIQRAQLFPAFDATGGLTNERIPPGVFLPTESLNLNQYSLEVGVTSWEIDFFGRIRSLKAAALEQYLATGQALRSAQISLAAEVAGAYLARAADCESLSLARSTLEARQATYDLMERRFRAGTSSALDVRQAETLLESARVDIARYTRQVAFDENALNLLAGATVPPALLAERLSDVTPPKEVSAGLSSDVLLARPDILQSEDLLKAANANIGAARAAFFPRFTLTTSAGTITPQLSKLFTTGAGTWLVNPQIDLPIFDAGARRASLRAAQADRDISVAQYEKAIQTAFRETADALAERGTLGDQIAAQESLVRASADTYSLSNARYLKGIDSYLAVLDAQRSLYAAQQGLINLHLAWLNNLVTLYKVLGAGT